jgi:hypothetical protein
MVRTVNVAKAANLANVFTKDLASISFTCSRYCRSEVNSLRSFGRIVLVSMSIEPIKPNYLSVKEEDNWDGSAQYSVVAKKLRQLGFRPSPFGNGLTFSIESETKTFYWKRDVLVIESAVYDSSSVIGVSRIPGRSFHLNHLIEAKRAFSIDLIKDQRNMTMPMWGPAAEDPVEFARNFFFILSGVFEDLAPRLPESPEILRLRDSHTTGDSAPS